MNGRFGVSEAGCQVLCECGDESCLQRVEVPLGVFAELRARNDRFIVARGHERRESERVVTEAPTYAIVAVAPAPERSTIGVLAPNPAGA